jgi:hypothetical protein
MTILPLICDKCGKSLTIETDIPAYIEKRKAEWEKEHKNCKENG